MDRIASTPDSLLRQARATASTYLMHAIKSIDDIFEEGYAATHPELVAGFIQACTADFHTAIIASVLQDSAEAIALAIAEADVAPFDPLER